MTYSDSLDMILMRIQEPTLTEGERETLRPLDPDSLQERYETLFVILENRGGVGNATDKLRSDASLVNVVIGVAHKSYSNVLIGWGVE
jgi:hypothetical protein